MRIRIMAVLTAATLTPGIATAAAPVQAATSTAVSTTQPAASALSTPIYFVHGFEYRARDNCTNTWGDAEKEARRSGFIGPFVTWGSYRNDAGCTRKVDGNQNTSIQELGRLLAWDIYDNYSKKGRPVDVLAHS